MPESPTLTNRYDFVYLFEVRDGNPNGDPDAGNQPRIDPETGHGLITDVCLKRKVRNFVAIARSGEAGYDIYVKERGILANEQRRAYQTLNLEPGDRPNEKARAWMCRTYFDIRAFGAVMTTGKTDESEAKKPGRGKAPRTDVATEELTAVSSTDAARETAKTAGKTKAKQWNCGQVRGPVQFTFARSIVPILSLEHAITRCALTNAGDTGRESTGDDEKAATLQMGRKMTIPYALYRAHGFISPHQAADTGFTEADLAVLWRALCQMFDHDRSATRGQMAARGLYVFKHGSKLGNAPAHVLQSRVTVRLKGGVKAPRSFSEGYTVAVDSYSLPAGVELIEYDCSSFADVPVVVLAK
jgi:CRISPR-associated protein Csd2